MSISRRVFLQGIGAAGAAAANARFVGSVLAQSLATIRSSFMGGFRLASSSLIEDGELSGIRLRWSYPLFNPDGTFARCLPDRVVVHRKIVSANDVFIPKTPDVGLPPIGLFPEYLWRTKAIVQISSNPAAFEFRHRGTGARTTVEAVTFGYEGNPTVLKIFGADGHCLMISPLSGGAQVYFDAAEIARFEFNGGGGANLRNARCLDASGDDGEFNINEPIATLEVRRPLVERISLEEGALRLNGLAASGGITTTLPIGQEFLDPAEWQEVIELSSEIAAPVCSGAPSLDVVDGIPISRTDLFMTSAVSRWEMAPRLGFGFRDGKNLSRSKYDNIAGPALELHFRDEVAFYQVTAIWDASREVLRSNVASTRLDQSFNIVRPREVRYVAEVAGTVESDCIAIELVATNSPSPSSASPAVDEIVGQTMLDWAHADHQRVAGILVAEQVRSPTGSIANTYDWFQHRAVFNEGFHGNVRRRMLVNLDDTVEAEIRSFDGWDTVSNDALTLAPRVALNYAPAAPQLACATHLASLEEVDGPIMIERLVTTTEFRPSCLPASPLDGSAPLEFADWEPDVLLARLLSKKFQFSLELMESIKPAKVVEVTIKQYARDGRGGFVRFSTPVDLVDFVGGFLYAGNGRYRVRSFVSDRLYIGRFETDLSDDFNQDGTCQLTSAATNLAEMDEPLIGVCRLSQDYDREEFWKTVKVVARIDGNPIDYTFVVQAMTPRPVELPDTVDYRLRLVGKRGTQIVVGEFSNIVSAQRLPLRPPQPRGLRVRQLGYDYYDRLLVCVELTHQDVPGNYAILFAPGRLDKAEAFVEMAEPATLIGPQSVGASLTMFEALPIGRNFLADRAFTVGVSRVNAAGTFGPPATSVIVVPVE